MCFARLMSETNLPNPIKRKGFFAKLFDFSFEEFITPSVARVVFVIFDAFVLLFAIIAFVSVVASEPGALGILVSAVGIAIGALLVIMLVRVALESKLVLFQIEKNTRR